MTKEDAIKKAQKPIPAVDGSTDNYLIPFEMGYAVKTQVDKKYVFKGKIITIHDWIGQNYLIDIDGVWDATPAMYFLQTLPGRRSRGMVEIKQ